MLTLILPRIWGKHMRSPVGVGRRHPRHQRPPETTRDHQKHRKPQKPIKN